MWQPRANSRRVADELWHLQDSHCVLAYRDGLAPSMFSFMKPGQLRGGL